MRHGKKFNHLGRKAAHRKAMLSNMACSLIDHKRINTTVAKAKALKQYVEPLITKAKDDSTHSRRIVFSYLRQKETIKELFGAVSSKVGERPGGYTRIIKTGNRLGDNAEMCMIELVDFNDVYTNGNEKKKTKTRRRKKTTAKVEETPVVEDAKVVEETADVEEAQVAEETPAVEETPVAETASEETNADVEEAPASDENSKDEEEKSNDANDENQEA
jgi:large subunit ribosomal protein L17